MNTEVDTIKATLNSYRDHLVASDAEGCSSLYTEDGVTMAQNFTTQVGIEAVKKWYGLCFSLISLDVTFSIEEVVVASGEYAFARTTSVGIQKRLGSGGTSSEGNQELFVMKKVKGEWKIARYCFCSTNPPK